MISSSTRRLDALLLPLALLILTLPVAADTTATPTTEDAVEAHPLDGLDYRNIGPVNMSGRVADVEGVPGDPRILYVGSASGGIWKTVNGGVTFEPVFDDQPIASIGDLALAPSNPEVIYAGTGEGNPRNSVSFGQGVWKSTDGGETWAHLGLKDTRYITRIAVHPADPDVAWVGALGSIFGPGESRGVFKTVDGGKTWEKVLYVDDRHGVADLDLDPNNPNVIFAAMWAFDRKPWNHSSGSEQGGVFRSVDGGKTWKKLENGLPKLLGRIGIKVAPSDPRVVYAITESDEGTLFRSEDRGETFVKAHDEPRIVSRGLYYTDLRVDPTDPDRVFAISSRLFRSIDGGKTFDRISASTHVDYHSLWIDPQDPKRMWQGQDGGIAASFDGGDTWDAPRNLPLAQFYQVFYDRRRPFYALGGGLQDNGTWIGPSRTREPQGILPDDWQLTSFGDAYFVVPHPRRVGLYLSEYQGGGIVRYDETTRQQVEVNPQTRRADGGPIVDLTYRFNWNAPIIQSPHDPDRVYFAGNVVFQTEDFGTTWQVISPDLTTDDPEKQGRAGGPVWYENTTAENHCTIISLAESEVKEGLLWVGTDDGKLQLSHDGGQSWIDLTAKLPVPEFSPVSHIEPSRVDAAIAYATFDRHMFDDFKPHLFKTTDFGETWSPLAEGLPEDGWLWVVREDPKNPDVLYAGSEVGLFISFDTGRTWQEGDLGDLPSVSVHDVLIHPDANDLIVGTHGRAIWVLDDLSPVQEWNDAQDESAYLFDIRPALRFPRGMSRYGLGDRVWTAPNPPYGAVISYFLKDSLEPEPEETPDPEGPKESEAEPAGEKDEEAAETAKDEQEEETTDGRDEESTPLTLEILDGQGRVIRALEDLPLGAGVHRVVWDLAENGPDLRADAEPGSDFRSPPRGARVVPGNYVARLTLARPDADDLVLEELIEVGIDPLLDVSQEDLVAQQALAKRVNGWVSQINRVLKAMDSVTAELADRRAAMARRELEASNESAALWKEVDDEIERQMDGLVRPEGKPFWSQGPRLSSHLQSLFQNVDSAFASPTRAQREFADELEASVEEAVAAWNGLVKGDLRKLSDALGKEGLGGLLPVEEVSSGD